MSARPRIPEKRVPSIFGIDLDGPPTLTEEEYSRVFGGRPGIDNVSKEGRVTETEARALRKENDTLKARIAELEAQLAGRARPRAPGAKKDDAKEGPAPDRAFAAEDLDDGLYQALKERLLKDAQVLRLLTSKPEIRVEVERQVIDLSHTTLRGRLAGLVADGFFVAAKTGHAAFQELERRGFRTAKPNVYKELDKLAELGFVTKEEGGYQAVAGMLVNLVQRGE